jgi:hypothetical protein
MITPSYSPTATERVLPRMALDFTTASLDSRVTVTRALNTATRVNSSGVIETVNADLPRFDYTLGSGGACKGLLIEEARTNSLTGVNLVNPTSTAQWITFGDAAGVFSVVDDTTALTSAGLFGLCSSGKVFKIDNSAGTTSFYARFNSTITIGSATWTYSGYVRGSGAITFQNNSGTWSGTTSPAVSNVYQRLTSTGVGAVSPTNFRIEASAGSVLYFILLQAEEGAFVTSAIPNTGSSVTRNADAVSMTGTNFSDWYNATEGTLQVIGSMNTASTSIFQTFAMIGDANNSLQIFNNLSASRFRGDIYSGGSIQKAFTYTAAGAPASGTTYNIIVGLKANDFAMAINGNTVATANSGLMPVSPSALYIGSVNIGIQQIGGYIRKLAYYNQKLTNAEIQAFSK